MSGLRVVVVFFHQDVANVDGVVAVFFQDVTNIEGFFFQDVTNVEGFLGLRCGVVRYRNVGGPVIWRCLWETVEWKGWWRAWWSVG